MSFSTEANWLLVIFITLVNGMPQKVDTFPVLQFTNEGSNVGGFRWAAEAGLGDLSGTGGGLYANAETPWGAYAGAGLDQLGEDNLGSIYAGAAPVGGSGPGVFLGSDVDQVGFDGIISGSADNEANLNPSVAAAATTATSSVDATASGTKVRTNIQIIRLRKEKEISTIHKRQAVTNDGTVAADKTVATSVVDDAFNVPITALSALNKFLNKAVGSTVAKTLPVATQLINI